MLKSEVKPGFHLVTLYAVGQLKDDDTHYFDAFFKSRIDALAYLNKVGPLYDLFDLSYQIPKETYLRTGDTFTMPGDNGVKYAGKI